MKKRLSFIFMLISISGLAVTASAANMNADVDLETARAGDQVTVTITLDDSIDVSAGATMMQGELSYDGSLLEFQSVKKSDQLSQADKNGAEDKVQFHYLSMDSRAVGFEAGTVAVASFKAKQEISQKSMEDAFQFSAYVQNAKGENVKDFSYTAAPSIKEPSTETPSPEPPSTEAPAPETPSTEAPAHVHSWNGGTVTKAATCKENGVMTYTCSCGQTKTEAIPKKTTHSYGGWKTVSEATVKAAEVQKRTCSVCGKTESKTVGKALTPVLELPGKLKSLDIKKGKSAKFKITMAKGDSITSVSSSQKKYLSVSSVNKKSGEVTLKGVKTGTAKLTVKLSSGKKRTYTVKVVSGTVKTTSLSVTSVTNKKLTLPVKKSHTLKYEVKPFTTTQKVTCKSSAQKIARVSSGGKITAVSPGKAVITVTSGSKSVKITVTVPGITVAKSSVSVKKNKTLTLKPKTYGISGKITYRSSNPKVAQVSAKGKVKGIKKGTAKITIKAGSFAKTVTVKVQ